MCLSASATRRGIIRVTSGENRLSSSSRRRTDTRASASRSKIAPRYPPAPTEERGPRPRQDLECFLVLDGKRVIQELSVDHYGLATVLSRHDAGEHDQEWRFGYSGTVGMRTQLRAGEPSQPRPVIITAPSDNRYSVGSRVRVRVDTQQPLRDLAEHGSICNTPKRS